MKASVQWINRYLEPAGLAAPDVERMLTDAGFPIDKQEPGAGGDVCLDVEVTSNRGDCLSHIGLAREIAARTGRKLKLPEIGAVKSSGDVGRSIALENTAPLQCPRFTVQVIRGCAIGPSPAWLAAALESVGQRPINNAVDVTNFLNFEFGQPCHVFDLAKLAGGKLVVRAAREGEGLTTLDGKKRVLNADEIVVADAQRAQSLAGVIGGADSEVSGSTRDIVLEAATWDPVAVRRAARRHEVKTDASHRFERLVDPRTIDAPARRAAALIAELTGGTLGAGMLDEGPAPAPLRQVRLRPDRCRSVLGFDISDGEIAALLGRLEVGVAPGRSEMLCTIPAFRPDLEREVDLIEEIARVRGFEAIPVRDRVTVGIKGPQESERAIVELGSVLSGLGFYETVTFSFVPPSHAAPFLSPGTSVLAVSDDRRKADGTLRPSTIPGLLTCRAKNQDAGLSPGDVRFFETAATFAQGVGNATRERRTLALLADVPGVGKGKVAGVPERQAALRIVRGALEAVCSALGGSEAGVELQAAAAPACDAGSSASVLLNGRAAGWIGIVEESVQRLFDLHTPVAAAEVELDPIIALFPPRSKVQSLPQFPAIDRDLSLVMRESVSWSDIHGMIRALRPENLESIQFIETYRGKQAGPGRKSMTFKLTFRDPRRTLRREEVDPQVAQVVAKAREQFDAELRS